jgi:hypothetical protein
MMFVAIIDQQGQRTKLIKEFIPKMFQSKFIDLIINIYSAYIFFV